MAAAKAVVRSATLAINGLSRRLTAVGYLVSRSCCCTPRPAHTSDTGAAACAMLAAECVHEMRAAGQKVYHLGFGQSPFGAPAFLTAELQRHAWRTDYLPVRGLPALCDAVRDSYARTAGVDTEQFEAFVAPGSKLLLYALQMSIPGDVILPVPSWVSYAPQAALLGQNTIPVQVPACPAPVVKAHRRRTQHASVCVCVRAHIPPPPSLPP